MVTSVSLLPNTTGLSERYSRVLPCPSRIIGEKWRSLPVFARAAEGILSKPLRTVPSVDLRTSTPRKARRRFSTIDFPLPRFGKEEMKKPVYLDYNASTPIAGEVRETMLGLDGCFGNPSSSHAFGRKALAVVAAREKSSLQVVVPRATTTR